MRQIIKLCCLVILLFAMGCVTSTPYQPKPYSQFYVPKEIIAAQKKVLLVGPMFSALGISDETWSKEKRAVWQKEIISQWAELNSNLFELITPDKNHYDLLAELIAKGNLDGGLLFRSQDVSTEDDKKIRNIFKILSPKAGVDAIVYTEFLIRPVKIQYNRVVWDGKIENIVDESHLKTFLKSAVGGNIEGLYEGDASAVSLGIRLVDKKGALLFEIIGGYKVLVKIREQLFDNKIENMDVMNIFGEEYKDDRTYTIEMTLRPLKEKISKDKGAKP